MAEFLFGLLELNLSMGAVIAALLALTPVLRRRFSPKWRYWAWLLVALRLAVPLNLSLPDAPVVLTAPAALAADTRYTPPVAIEADAPAPADPRPEGRSAHQSGLLDTAPLLPNPLPGGTELRTPAARPTPQRTEGARIDPPGAVTALWAAGAAAFLAVQFGSCFRFRRRTRRWSRPDGRWEGVPLVVCPAIATPVLLGFFRPVVVLPEGLGQEARGFALAHELAHLRRGDLWYKLLLVWVGALHWWNPLVWLLRRTAAEELEMACDAAVLTGKDGAYRRAYGVALLSLAARGNRPAALTSAFSGGARGLKDRFRALAHGAPTRFGKAALAALCCAVVLGASLVACRSGPADGVYYGQFRPLDPLEGEITLELVDYDPERNTWSRGDRELTLPLAETVRRYTLGGTEFGADRSMSEFLYFPLWSSYGRLGGGYLLTATVEGGTVTALEWIWAYKAPPADGTHYALFDYFHHAAMGEAAQNARSLNVALVDYDPGAAAYTEREDGWRAIPVAEGVSFPAEGEETLDDFLLRPLRGENHPVGGRYLLEMTIRDGEIAALDWAEGYSAAGPNLPEDGVYYALWPILAKSRAAEIGALAAVTAPLADYNLITDTLLAVGDVHDFPVSETATWDGRRDGDPEQNIRRMWQMLDWPLLSGETHAQWLLQMRVEGGKVTDFSWVTSEKVGYRDSDITVRDVVIHGVDTEQRTVTCALDDGQVGADSVWVTMPVAEGAPIRLRGDLPEGLEGLEQRVLPLSTWGLSCEVTVRGMEVTGIRVKD